MACERTWQQEPLHKHSAERTTSVVRLIIKGIRDQTTNRVKAEALEGWREGWWFSLVSGLLKERSSSIREVSCLATLSSLWLCPFLLNDAPMKSIASLDETLGISSTTSALSPCISGLEHELYKNKIFKLKKLGTQSNTHRWRESITENKNLTWSSPPPPFPITGCSSLWNPFTWLLVELFADAPSGFCSPRLSSTGKLLPGASDCKDDQEKKKRIWELNYLFNRQRNFPGLE